MPRHPIAEVLASSMQARFDRSDRATKLCGHIFETTSIQIVELKRLAKESRQAGQLKSQHTSDLPICEIAFGIIVAPALVHKEAFNAPWRLVVRQHSPAIRRPESYHTLVDNDSNDPR
jgi:hypothetical protein